MAEWIGQHPYLYVLVVIFTMAVVSLLIKYVGYKLNNFRSYILMRRFRKATDESDGSSLDN